MKRFYGIAAIVALFFLAAVAHAFNYPQWPTQQGNPIQCNFGFKKVATPTLVIEGSAPASLADYLPEGTLGFELRAASGSFIIGHPDNIETGANRIGRLVEEDKSYIWNGLAGGFVGAAIASDSTCTVVIDGAWGY